VVCAANDAVNIDKIIAKNNVFMQANQVIIRS
jgi:hypothetical protein